MTEELIGPLAPWWLDDTVTDVMLNGDGRVWIDGADGAAPTGLQISRDQASRLLETMCLHLGLRLDRTHPVAEGRLPDGSRICAVIPPATPDGPILCVRRFRSVPLSLDAFGPPEVVRRLQAAVDRSDNLIVFGPTGSGKTSLVAALCRACRVDTRFVVIEDPVELRLGVAHAVRLEVVPAAGERGASDLGSLVRTALRLRPDRVVVGEVRGDEALDMVWALSTGHRGSFSTVHASAPEDARGQLIAMALGARPSLGVEAVRARVDSAVDAYVGVVRHASGLRQVSGMWRTDRPAIAA